MNICKEHLLRLYKENRNDLIFMIVLYIITLFLIYTGKNQELSKPILYIMTTIFEGYIIYIEQKLTRKYYKEYKDLE